MSPVHKRAEVKHPYLVVSGFSLGQGVDVYPGQEVMLTPRQAKAELFNQRVQRIKGKSPVDPQLVDDEDDGDDDEAGDEKDDVMPRGPARRGRNRDPEATTRRRR